MGMGGPERVKRVYIEAKNRGVLGGVKIWL